MAWGTLSGRLSFAFADSLAIKEMPPRHICQAKQTALLFLAWPGLPTAHYGQRQTRFRALHTEEFRADNTRETHKQNCQAPTPTKVFLSRIQKLHSKPKAAYGELP